MLAPVAMSRERLDHDVAMVQRAAGLLQIPEFDFFRLAYRRWHGRSARDRELEPGFMRYLLGRRVPPWARHLAREVHERDQERSLVPRDYGVAPVLPPPADAASERRRQLFLALVYGGCFAQVTLCAL